LVDDDDQDPELDEALLKKVELTPQELLDGYMESKESRRGAPQFLISELPT
jgi:hypothetical protein